MPQWSTETLIAVLARRPTESTLSLLRDRGACDYSVCPDLLDLPTSVGHVVIETADAWLLIPVIAVKPGAGWERLDLTTTIRIPHSVAEAHGLPGALATYWRAVDALRETAQAAVDAVTTTSPTVHAAAFGTNVHGASATSEDIR